MKALIRAAYLALSILFVGVAAAQHDHHADSANAILAAEDVAEVHSTAHGEEGHAKFNPGEMIMGHVTDEHGWHLWGHTTLPLPIIVYNTERGFTCFSSGH